MAKKTARKTGKSPARSRKKAAKKRSRPKVAKKRAGAKVSNKKAKVAKKKAKVAKKKTSRKPARKAPAKKAAARKTARKRAAPKKAAPKRATPKKRSAAKIEAARAQVAATIKRPIPRMPLAPKRRAIHVAEIAGMTRPDDIEKIISQLSDLTPETSAVRETKFDIGVKHNGTAMAEHELPSEYGKDRVILLVVDPNFVFTYWEVRQDSLQEASSRIGHDGKLTLRFYDVGTSYNPEQSNFWDVEVFDRLGNWYLKLAHPEQHICLDIGLKNSRGHFYRIARSNLVKLPQQSLAKPGPIKWMVVTPSGERSISDVEEYTDADLALLKKILGPYFFDLLMRGRLASIAGSSVEAVFFSVEHLKQGASPQGGVPWATSR